MNVDNLNITMSNPAYRRLEIIGRHLNVEVSNFDSLTPQNTCGIIAFVGKDSAINYLLDGITILQNRGYDSAGVTTITHEGELVTTKFASHGTTSNAIEKLRKNATAHSGHNIGIAHTRWATHGGKTDKNAHPHMDRKNRVALVHNGVIQNATELRNELVKNGISFRSETDTEVIVQLIGAYLDAGHDFIEAIKKTTSRLEGTWGVCILHKDKPDLIVAARNGSPLLIGVGKEQMFIASEASAFSQHTKEFVSLENGEIAIIKMGMTMDVSRIERAEVENVNMTPDPWAHWTIKEIMEQPDAISKTLNYGGRFDDEQTVKLGGLDVNKTTLLKIQNLIITGCGTSYHAGLYGAHIMKWLKSVDTVQVIDSAEVYHETLPQFNGGLLCLSQSGETKDVMRALAIAQESNIPTFSIINVVGSQIARLTRCGIYLNAGREVGVASTKTFTCQVAALCLVAIWFSQNRNGDTAKRQHAITALQRLATNTGMLLRNSRTTCAKIADRLKTAPRCFILGKGFAESIAREGALKIKEITYLHAEGYPGGSLKHGPFALIEPGIPVILIILDDRDLHLMKIAAEEVKARGAYVIAITDRPDTVKEVADDIITIPSNGILTALLAVIPLQVIAYELAVRKGIDPDKPRNLAKAVTTD